MENIVVFAAGGGNDVFSAMVYIKTVVLSSFSIQNVALVGLLGLTPFHYPSELQEKEIYTEPKSIVPTSEMVRYIPMNPPKKITCLERHIPLISSRIVPGLNKYLCVSSKYSIQEQTSNLFSILTAWNFSPNKTKLLIVDFGGDILSDGTEDTIISPELDAYTLCLVKNLNHLHRYTAETCIGFPGVDGELPKDVLFQRCNQLSIRKESVNAQGWLESIDKILSVIENERPGNTLPSIKKVLTNNPSTVEISKKWRVGKEILSKKMEVALDSKLQPFLWYFRLEDIMYNPYIAIFPEATVYNLKSMLVSLLEIYSRQDKTKDRFQSSDLFLGYLRKDRDGYWTNKELQLSSTIRDEIIYVDVFPGCIDPIQCENIGSVVRWSTL